MMVDIPDRHYPLLLSKGIEMGRMFSRAVCGPIECLLLVRAMIEKHPDDLEQYLTDFLYGVKVQESSHD